MQLEKACWQHWHSLPLPLTDGCEVQHTQAFCCADPGEASVVDQLSMRQIQDLVYYQIFKDELLIEGVGLEA